MNASFPKLLVATEFPPNASGGGPAVVRQMLKDWPSEQLSWWSCFPDENQRFGQRTASNHVAAIPKKLLPQRRVSKLKSALLNTIWVPWATRHFRQTLALEKPDVVWVIPHNWSILPIANVLTGRTPGMSSPPFHVTVQDYAEAHHQANKFGNQCCHSMVTGAERLYATATTRDATSHPMIADLLEKTGQPAAQMLHAGLEPEDFKFLESKSSVRNGPIRIAYAGTILVEDVFVQWVAACQRIRQTLTQPLELHLFGAHSYAGRDWFDREWMQEHGNLPEDELLQQLRACDWGFAPMALTDHDPRYNRFSFPTKFITYLAAGLPVITLGHPESSVMKMACTYQVGLCSNKVDLEELSTQLRTVLSDPEPWTRFKNEIIRCAKTEFNAETMRRKLYNCFGRDA